MATYRFVNSLIFVSDMKVSLKLYRELLGQRIVQDHGDFVQLQNGLALHVGEALEQTIFGKTNSNAAYGGQNFVLYFEVDELDTAFQAVAQEMRLIHPVEKQAWGQRVLRFYDPDGHIVEIGEPQ